MFQSVCLSICLSIHPLECLSAVEILTLFSQSFKFRRLIERDLRKSTLRKRQTEIHTVNLSECVYERERERKRRKDKVREEEER